MTYKYSSLIPKFDWVVFANNTSKQHVHNAFEQLYRNVKSVQTNEGNNTAGDQLRPYPSSITLRQCIRLIGSSGSGVKQCYILRWWRYYDNTRMSDILLTLWRLGDYRDGWLVINRPNSRCAGEGYERSNPELGRLITENQSNANGRHYGNGANQLKDGWLNDGRRAKNRWCWKQPFQSDRHYPV